MPVTNWPPASLPAPWPPPEIGSSWFSCSDVRVLWKELQALGFTRRNARPTENQLYFNNARCDEGHQVNGIMVVSPDGNRLYPFCACRDINHKQLLVLWPPDYCLDSQSGAE